MAYRNKTYIAFDADTDIDWYRLLTAWKSNGRFPLFDFFDAHDINKLMPFSSEATIKLKLLERLRNTKFFVLLVGAKTKHLHKYVRWEIEQAVRLEIPILAINLNKMRSIDSERCPPVLREELAMHVSFEQAIIEHAFAHWPDSDAQHRRDEKRGPYHYTAATYGSLGL